MVDENGQQLLASNYRTMGEATRCVDPGKGRSVIIDDLTVEIIQVGGRRFRFDFQFGPPP